MKKYLLILVAGLFVLGCKKDDDNHHDGEYHATINITSPAEGAMGTVGHEMDIEAEIEREDNKIIHNVTVSIEDADGNVVETLVDNEHIHAEGHYHISEKFTPTAHGEHTLIVLTNDHMDASKKVEASRTFMAMMPSYDVTVDIQEPAENTILAVNDNLPVKVVYTHADGGKIHHVLIEIYDDADNLVATLDHGHKHVDGTYTFESANSYTATVAGTFKLVAKTLNHDMSIVKMAERTFTVQ